jgi:hypothetical protein
VTLPLHSLLAACVAPTKRSKFETLKVRRTSRKTTAMSEQQKLLETADTSGARALVDRVARALDDLADQVWCFGMQGTPGFGLC